jgi:hypothetical protein
MRASIVGIVLSGLLGGAVRVAHAQGATWTIAATPTVRLGASESADATLAAPAGATRLPNGNIVVGDVADFALGE